MEKRGQGEGARTIERTESHRKEAEDDDRDELIAGMTAGQYLASRAPTLRPAMAPLANPFKTLALLNRQQWLFFLVGFLAWALDAMDFFTVSLTITNLAKEFHRKNSDITWGITLVLMLRSVGAIIFGIASDRYGRKWPFVVNNVLFIVLEIATGFCSSFKSFLVIRALFGIAMGGLYGNAAATALEDCPAAARGLVSGLYQQGYAFGYLLATVFSRALVDTTAHGWRPLFWFCGTLPVFVIIFRLFLPETQAFEARQRVRQQARQQARLGAEAGAEAGAGAGARAGASAESIGGQFVREGRQALRQHWLLLTYMVLLMAGFNFMSHGSQDLYPTRLKGELGLTANAATATQVVANVGAMAGGSVVGYASQAAGRRLSIIASCLLGAALLYPYSYARRPAALVPAAFCEQFFVQGAWGVVPIHLLELAPASLRTFIVGTAYQLGNLASSASSTIEARLGERFPLPAAPAAALAHHPAEQKYAYGKVICLFMAVVYVYLIVVTFLGPERLGRRLDGEELDGEAIHGHAVDARAVDAHALDTEAQTTPSRNGQRQVYGHGTGEGARDGGA